MSMCGPNVLPGSLSAIRLIEDEIIKTRNNAYDKGYKDGFSKGVLETLAESRNKAWVMESAARLMKRGTSPSMIKSITGFTVDELKFLMANDEKK